MSAVQAQHVCKRDRGIGLVEVIAAVGVAVIVITSLVSLSVFSLRSSLQSKLYLEGTKTANKQIELVRALRDITANWTTFISSVTPCSAACYMTEPTGGMIAPTVSVGTKVTGTGLSTVTYFFTATNVNGGALISTDQTVRVRASASWPIGGQTISTNVYTDLTNWRGQ